MKPTRILFLTTRQTSVLQYMVRDLAHGFRRLGCDVEIMMERHGLSEPQDEFYQGAWSAKVDRIARWFQPHCIFQMDHLRGENPLMWGAGPVYASWMQDAMPHLFSQAMGYVSGKELIASVGPKDLILTSFPGLRQKMIDAGYPEANLVHLPVAANFDMFYPAPFPLEGPLTIGFPCNVGHTATSSMPERYHRRVDPVKWLIDAGVNVKLWGQGWDKLEWAKPFHQGPVKNGPELRDAYNSCHVILHANSDTNLHQRPFEAVACGRPVLMWALENDAHPDGILKHRLPGVCRFSTKDDILHSLRQTGFARQMMEQEPEYLAKVRANEDYPSRCKRILELVEERL